MVDNWQKKQNNDFLDSKGEDSDEISKSALKREAETLKDLGRELIKLKKSSLDRIPLDTELRDAIELAQRIKKEGLRRQIQLIGKLLRSRDTAPISAALDDFHNRNNQQTLRLHKLEQLRDQLIEYGDDAIQTATDIYPNLDRQHLRTLIRTAKKEQAENKPESASRAIFRYLRDLEESKK